MQRTLSRASVGPRGTRAKPCANLTPIGKLADQPSPKSSGKWKGCHNGASRRAVPAIALSAQMALTTPPETSQIRLNRHDSR